MPTEKIAIEVLELYQSDEKGRKYPSGVYEYRVVKTFAAFPSVAAAEEFAKAQNFEHFQLSFKRIFSPLLT